VDIVEHREMVKKELNAFIERRSQKAGPGEEMSRTLAKLGIAVG
jgi:hypothetical protein